MRARAVVFRVICEARNTQGHDEVMRLLAARSILLNVCTTKCLPDESGVMLSVPIKPAFGVQAIHLARIFEHLPAVNHVELEVEGRPVDFHGTREASRR